MILYGHCQDYCLWDFKKLTEENNDFVDIFHGFFFLKRLQLFRNLAKLVWEKGWIEFFFKEKSGFIVSTWLEVLLLWNFLAWGQDSSFKFEFLVRVWYYYR